MAKICTFSEFVDGMAPVFQAAGLPAPTARDLLDQLVSEQRAEANAINAANRGLGGNWLGERAPLRDEKGKVFGRHVAEIPEKVLYHYMAPKHCGGLGLSAKEAEDYILKKQPEYRVKTVMQPRFYGANFGRTRRRKPGVIFGRGTMNFAE